MENRKKRNMYRWTVWFLSVFLILTLCAFPALADEECPEGEHDWVLDNYDAPTCYEEGLAGYYCSKCGDWKREIPGPLFRPTGKWKKTTTSVPGQIWTAQDFMF